jgi:hypothetical protein
LHSCCEVGVAERLRFWAGFADESLVFTRRSLSPARWLSHALRRHGDAVFEYAHFLTRDDTAARALQRAAFLDAHQALMLGGRLKRPRRWLLRAVRDTAPATQAADEELAVLRRTCGLRSSDAEWVVGVDAEHGRSVGRRTRVAAGAGAGAAMAARTSTAKALAAQIPGFTAASATSATHLIVASVVASSALVGTAAVTKKLEERPHRPSAPAHATTNPRPANATSDRSGPTSSGTAGDGSRVQGAQGADNSAAAGQTVGQSSEKGKNPVTDPAAGQGSGQGTTRGGTGQGSAGRTDPQPPPTGDPATSPRPKQLARAPSTESGKP